MKAEADVTLPEMALVLGTRAALGIGLGLCLANRFSEDGRRAVGGTLLLAGVLGAAVIASEVFDHPRTFHFSLGRERGEPRGRSEIRERSTEQPAEMPVI